MSPCGDDGDLSAPALPRGLLSRDADDGGVLLNFLRMSTRFKHVIFGARTGVRHVMLYQNIVLIAFIFVKNVFLNIIKLTLSYPFDEIRTFFHFLLSFIAVNLK